MLFCMLLNRFVMLYLCFVRYSVVLCIVMLFRNDVTLFYRLQYCGVSYYITLQRDIVVLCLVMLFCVLLCFFFNSHNVIL